MLKIVRWVIAVVATALMFVVSTMLHNTETLSGGIIGDTTQIQFLSSTGIMYYLMATVLITVATIAGHRTRKNLLTALSSWGLMLVRVVGSLSMISGGTSMYVFDSKAGQAMQLMLAVYVIIIQSVVSGVYKRKRSSQAVAPVE